MSLVSRKQRVILDTLAKQQVIALPQAVRLIGGNIYHNESKHVGAVLSNMVKRGMIRRLSPGVFALPEQPNPEAFTLDAK
jgi:hypothetical protein